MTIETATNIYDLNSSLPADGDEQAEGDDHIRMIKAALKASLPGLQGALHRAIAKSAGFTPALTENGCVFNCTGGITASLLAIAGVPDGTHYWINASSGAVTIDPNGSETINGATTITMPSGSWGFVFKLGTAWFAMLGPGDLVVQFAAIAHAATSKTPPVDADELPLIDSAASYGLKKLTWANLKSALSSLFMALVAPGASGNLLTSNGSAWTSAAAPAAGVTSVGGNTGAVTDAQLKTSVESALGYSIVNGVSKDMGHGNVGSLCFATTYQTTTDVGSTYTPGTTIAGSYLRACGIVIGYDNDRGSFIVNGPLVHGSALSGTWRCLGYSFKSYSNQYGYWGATLWQRIS